MSLVKARTMETSFAESIGSKEISAEFMQIYRSMEVGQSYFISLWTSLIFLVHAFWLMIRIRPQVIAVERNDMNKVFIQLTLKFLAKQKTGVIASDISLKRHKWNRHNHCNYCVVHGSSKENSASNIRGYFLTPFLCPP